MSKIKPQDRPTFKVAHRLRCYGLMSRESFLEFQTEFETIVNTITSYSGEELWEYVASLFGVSDYADCVPINSANLSITWAPVVRCLNRMTTDWNRDISVQKRENIFVPIISLARDVIAQQLNVPSDTVAMCRGSSEANGVITNGLDFKDPVRNQVVVWSENHPTMSEIAWKIRQQRPGFNNMVIKKVEIPQESLESEVEIIDCFKAQIEAGKTLIVAFSHISNLSGARLPVRALCEAIHKMDKEIHVHCDGAQAWGAIEQDLTDIGFDSGCGSSHKWMLGPKETGFLYVKKDRIPKIWPKDIGYNTKVESPTVVLPTDASRFEMLGQRNDLSIMAMLYSADLMGLIGFDQIEGRIKCLAEQLRLGLGEIDSKYFEIETPKTPAHYHAIITLKFKDEWYLPSAGNEDISVAVYNVLYRDYKIGVSVKSENRLRFSPHIHNTKAHMDRAVEAVKEILKKAKIRRPSSK